MGSIRSRSRAHRTSPTVSNFKVDYVLQITHVPVGFWRSVGRSINAFVFESMLDEVAHAAGGTRTRSDASCSPTTRVSSRCSIWSRRRPAGAAAGAGRRGRRGRGIVLHESFGSLVAQVAEVTVQRGGALVDRSSVPWIPALWSTRIRSMGRCAAASSGLSAALLQKITIEKGRVVEANFDSYPLAAMTDVPVIEVHRALGRGGGRHRRAGDAAGRPGSRQRDLRSHRQADPHLASSARST